MVTTKIPLHTNSTKGISFVTDRWAHRSCQNFGTTRWELHLAWNLKGYGTIHHILCWLSTHEVWNTEGTRATFPLLVPFQPWEDLSLDFIMGLPSYRRNTIISVVVDRFSKGIYFGMFPTHYTSHSIALLFMDIVGKLHRMPRSLVSDCNPLFISRLNSTFVPLSIRNLLPGDGFWIGWNGPITLPGIWAQGLLLMKSPLVGNLSPFRNTLPELLMWKLSMNSWWIGKLFSRNYAKNF